MRQDVPVTRGKRVRERRERVRAAEADEERKQEHERRKREQAQTRSPEFVALWRKSDCRARMKVLSLF